MPDAPPIPSSVLRDVAGLSPDRTFDHESFASYGGEWSRVDGEVVWHVPMVTVANGAVASELLAARDVLGSLILKHDSGGLGCQGCGFPHQDFDRAKSLLPEPRDE